jgi:hypothetical protein
LCVTTTEYNMEVSSNTPHLMYKICGRDTPCSIRSGPLA